MRKNEVLLTLVSGWAVALWVGRIFLGINVLPDQRFGTASAPLSEALTPWLEGTLRYYFFGEPIHTLSRPTIGIFFSSLLTLFGQVEAIPLCFVGACAVLFVMSAITLPRSAALALIVGVLLCVIPEVFNRTMGASLINTLLVDFPSFVFLVSGVLLLASSLSQEGSVGIAFCVAFLLFGLNAAIRGPMLVGGPVLFLAVHLLCMRKMSIWITPLALFVFVLPIALDLLIQHQYGLANGWAPNLYCVAADPTHSWTPECHRRFIAEGTTLLTAVTKYARFAASEDGVKIFFQYAGGRLAVDSRILVSLYFFGALLFCLLAEFLASSGKEHRERRSALKLVPAPLAWVALSLIGPEAASPLSSLQMLPLASILGPALVILCLLAVFREAPLTWICLTTYLCSVIFFSIAGLPFLGRTAGSYTFLLPLGVLASVLEEPLDRECGRQRPMQETYACLWMIMIIFMYAGTFSITTDTQERYRLQVYARHAAIKVADTPERDRSLYFNGDGRLFYSRYDGVPRWALRNYSVLDPPQIDANASYNYPVKFGR